MKIEVIVQNEKDARDAEKAGADRLELVSAINEGGLTPAYDTIKGVLESVTIPVFVMVRPHSRTFNYNAADWSKIEEDVKMVKTLGAPGIVFGCLNENNEINEATLSKVINLIDGMGMTFHRAFDDVVNQEKAYQTLCSYKAVERILTSGGAPKAEEGLNQLQRLVNLSKESGGPKILVGSGLNSDNVNAIHNVLQAKEYHFGSGVRVNGSFLYSIDSRKIGRIRELV
ncbi:copper homeostasis protein [Scopulibacillus darangshiensis]|uniref:PF03932 family protein CutC n=1 Tax=Scopulibacillus darangshiensis TaxID=442528 RepID=A0A4R2P5S6_9BACL|nr:copper homeostasis protein CutC [Scopulibacillus darangshiensis]TCP29558.1 copper homeostasis protein [Scopulibacillus darangshiensis]